MSLVPPSDTAPTARLSDRLRSRASHTSWLMRTLGRSRFLAPMSPATGMRMGAATRKYGVIATSGFALTAARIPDATALIDERGSLTWRELDSRSDALSVGFNQLGDKPPTTVGLLIRNHRGFVEALIAASRSGADMLLLNTSFAGPQLAEVVEREGIDILVYDEEFEEIVAGVKQAHPHARFVLAWTDEPTDKPSVEGLITGFAGRSPDKPERTGRLVLLTSGTTGTPKGARRPSGGGAGDLAAVLDRVPWRFGETTVVAAPMFHAWGYGQLVIGAVMGNTIVMRRRFDPESTIALIAEHRAQGLSVVPVMIERIIDLPADVRDKYDCSSLRFVTASGSRMRPDAVTSFMDYYGDVIYNSYNATEAGQIATATPADLRVAPDTAGRPVAGTEVRILDSEGSPVPTGEVGQMFVRNTTQFEGYTSGDTKSFLDGFMASGDLGRLDDAGRIFVVGRDDDMIVSGGENVYPIETEKVIGSHPGVRETVVIGVDDEKFGQRLAAYVVREPGAETTADDLKEHVREQLANYKVPRSITFLDELPRNASGKVVARELPDEEG